MKKRVLLAVVGVFLSWAWGQEQIVRAQGENQRLCHTLASVVAAGGVARQLEWSIPALDLYPEVLAVTLYNPQGELVLQKTVRGGAGKDIFEPVHFVGGGLGRLGLRVSYATQSQSQSIATALALACSLLWLALTRPRQGSLQPARPESTPLHERATSSDRGGDLVLELDSSMNIVSLRGEQKELGGYSHEDLIGKSISQVLDAKHVPTDHRSLESLSGLATIKTKAGNLVSSEFSTATVNRADGQLERVIVVLKNGERSSGVYRKRINDLEQQYRLLCEAASDLVIVASSDGAIFYVNRAGTERGGYGTTALAGTPLWDLLDDGEASDLRQTFHRILVGEKMPAIAGRLRCFDGSTVPVEGGFSLVQAGGTLAVMGIFRDLTERLQGEEALRASEERLRQAQKMEAMGRLAGGVAHDFNNLLTIFSAVTDLLASGADRSASDCELLDELEQAVGRAAALTGQLLLFCRQRVAEPEVVCITEVVSDLLKMAQRVLGEDLKLTRRLKAQSRILADRSELEQILMNLLVNARDAMPNGGELVVETGDVRLPETAVIGATLPSGSYVQLRVSDTGTGIPQDTLDKIFEPYFTTKPVGEGTGLGLSTVYAAVQRLGGGLQVETQVGKGTSFLILIPTTEAIPLDDQGKASPVSLGHGQTLLLVEDEDSVRSLLGKALRKAGYSVLEASDAQEALVHLAQTPQIQGMVTDLVMPGMHGRLLASRARMARPELPVLFISGYPADAIDCMSSKDDFLTKPLGLDALIGRVHKMLGES